MYVKNFTLAIKHEFENYGITVQLVTPMYVRTKMNAYSSWVMAGNILIPDVQSYTKSVVFSLGKTNETTGYWAHGIQVKYLYEINYLYSFLLSLLHNLKCIFCFSFFLQYGAMKLVPSWLRILIGLSINKKFRAEYYEQQKIDSKLVLQQK